MSDVLLHPEWRQAVIKFTEAGFRPGDVVTHAWLYAALSMQDPNTAANVAEYQKLSLKYLSQFKALEKWLLHEERLMLVRRTGVGYLIVKPEDQAKTAMDEFVAKYRKEYGRAGDRMSHTRLDELTAEQRREHADAMCKLASMRNMLPARRALQLPEYTGDG